MTMKKNKLLFVTNCSDRDQIAKFEQQAKNAYHSDSDKPCLTFMHNAAPHVVDQKEKDKKPTHVIYDGITPQAIIMSKSRIEKRRNGSSPAFIVIGASEIVAGTTAYHSHKEVSSFLLQTETQSV